MLLFLLFLSLFGFEDMFRHDSKIEAEFYKAKRRITFFFSSKLFLFFLLDLSCEFKCI